MTLSVPQWPCPKCGAIPETTLHREYTREQRLKDNEWYQAASQGGMKQPWPMATFPELPRRSWCSEVDEHLHHKCGRCGYKWTTVTVDA